MISRLGQALGVGVIAATFLAGCGQGVDEAQSETDDTATEAASATGAECIDDPTLDAATTSDSPIVAFGADCKPIDVGPGWSEDVPCSTMWQVGSQLPAYYTGCEAPDGIYPLERLRNCDDTDLNGWWTYDGLVAQDGGVIRKLAAKGC